MREHVQVGAHKQRAQTESCRPRLHGMFSRQCISVRHRLFHFRPDISANAIYYRAALLRRKLC